MGESQAVAHPSDRLRYPAVNQKRLLLVALALSVVALCVAIFLLAGSGSSEWTKTLPDGSVLTLRRITTGKKHRCSLGNFFQRTASHVMPDPWAKKLGAREFSCFTTAATHVYWLERIKSTNYGIGSMIVTGLRITNEAGFDRMYEPVAQFVTPAGDVWAYRFDAVPTDCSHIRFAAGRSAFNLDSKVIFEVANPTFVAHRKWQAAPCPIVVEQDEVSLCLERFTTGVRRNPGGQGLSSTEVAFVIRDRAVPTNNWFARSVRVLNEAGAEFTNPFQPTEASTARSSASFPFGLSSAEPYKLRFELRRTSYAPDDLHVFQAVPVPVATGPPFQPLRARLQGFTIGLTLSPRGAIFAGIESPPSDWRLDLVRVIDGRGRWMLARRDGASSDGVFSGTIALEPDSATVDLTFALTRLRTIEVIARPSLGQ